MQVKGVSTLDRAQLMSLIDNSWHITSSIMRSDLKYSRLWTMIVVWHASHGLKKTTLRAETDKLSELLGHNYMTSYIIDGYREHAWGFMYQCIPFVIQLSHRGISCRLKYGASERDAVIILKLLKKLLIGKKFDAGLKKYLSSV